MSVQVVFCVARKADDLDFLHLLEDAALHTTGGHGAATFDVEHVFDRQQEGLVDRALGYGDVLVHRRDELEDLLLTFGIAVQGLEGRTLDDGDGVAGEFVLGEQVAHFHLDEVEQFGVVHHVALVQEDDERGHADLTGEQDVLAGLGHGAVRGGHHEDAAVHLRGAGDHVLDVVGVAGAVDVRVVALVALVLDVGGVDRDAALFFFGSGVDAVVGHRLCLARLGQDRGDGGRQRGLAVVDVADGAHVHVRFRSLEFVLGHGGRWLLRYLIDRQRRSWKRRLRLRGFLLFVLR